MFWTKPGKSWSLARRLSIWYAVSAFLLLSIATGWLYWGTVRRFHQQNDEYLQKKINTLEGLLRDSSQRLATVQWEVEEESYTHSAVRLLSRVMTADGTVLFETSGMSKDLPRNLLKPSRFQDDGIDIRTPAGEPFRVMESMVPAVPGSGSRAYRLQVAIDLGYENRLLQSYLDQLWIVLGIGLIGAVFVGYRIAHSGIAPIEAMAKTVKQVKSSTLSERLRLEGMPSELSVLAEAFNDVLERLEDAFSRLSRFSSDLAHELRTPIGNVRGEIEVALKRIRSGSEYREVMQSSLEECQKLSRLIDRLLFLARSEHPEAQVHKEALQVNQELEAVLDFYEPAATEQGVELKLEASGELTAEIDRSLFQVAVGNVVDNAVRHTPAGGTVTIAATVESEALIITVSDTGVGIDAQHLPHVFERFYRADPARSRDGNGAGLGLALVEMIARLHKGNASITSVVGKGTSVTVTLPSASRNGNDAREIEPLLKNHAPRS